MTRLLLLLPLLAARQAGAASSISLEPPKMLYVLDRDLTDRITRTFSFDIAYNLNFCQYQLSGTCSIKTWAEDFDAASSRLRRAFDSAPLTPFPMGWCPKFFDVLAELDTKEASCVRLGDWPPVCQSMRVMIQKFMSAGSELAVVCAMINPTDKYPLPNCTKLVHATISSYESLVDCTAWNRSYCVESFCHTQEVFAWRTHPANLLTDANQIYAGDFVLPGCEHFRVDRSGKDCQLREDIIGLCDCFCAVAPEPPPVPKEPHNIVQLVQTLAGYGNLDCEHDVNTFLSLSRLGVSGAMPDPLCQSALCGVFEERRTSNLPSCKLLQLPTTTECLAMQLPLITNGEMCPFLTSTDTDGLMECLDGHFCAVQPGVPGYVDEGWSCCADGHKGRARCPKDTPVMCDELCSGTTEFCCRQKGECTPRTCSVLLEPTFEYAKEWRPGLVTTTLEQWFLNGSNASGTRDPDPTWLQQFLGSISFDLKLLGWLILIIPCCAGVVAMCFWRRIKKRLEAMLEAVFENNPNLVFEERRDKFSAYYVIAKSNHDEKPPGKAPLVRIIVRELPIKRPLGLELQETLVVKVHRAAMKYGWMEGDVIVSIAGHEVTCFEQLWSHVQVERDRVPVVFMVRRLGVGVIDEAAIAATKGEKSETRGRHRTQQSPKGSPQASEKTTIDLGGRSIQTMSPMSESVDRCEPFSGMDLEAAATAIQQEMDDENALLCQRFEDQDSYAGPRTDGLLMCCVCRTFIVGAYTQAYTEIFHPECFCCYQCRQILDTRYLRNEQGYSCTACRPRCAACTEPFNGEPPVYVEGERYHAACFRCCFCRNSIAEQTHYRVEEGHCCQLCHTMKEGGLEPPVINTLPGQPFPHPGQITLLATVDRDIESGLARARSPRKSRPSSSPSNRPHLEKPVSRMNGEDAPPWLARLAAKPRIDQAFEKKALCKDIIDANKPVGKSYKEHEALHVRDAWGRNIIKIKR